MCRKLAQIDNFPPPSAKIKNTLQFKRWEAYFQLAYLHDQFILTPVFLS